MRARMDGTIFQQSRQGDFFDAASLMMSDKRAVFEM